MLFVSAMSRVLLNGRIRQRLIVFLPSLLFLLLRIQTTNAQPELAVQVVFNGGIIPEGKGCEAKEFETVKAKIFEHLDKPYRRSMQSVNCK